MNVVTRIAPSPTGQMHIGTVRTALFNYLFAKKHGGTFFVRIEDTDKARNKPEWVDLIGEDFAWVGLDPDARYVQSDHLARHKELLQKLVDSGSAYISHEAEGENREVVRFKNPNTVMVFQDLVRGEVRVDTTDLGDFIVARNINDPLYHFAVVVDDGDSGVTHVIRADEHISNTPRQILLLEALGFKRPIYAHIPLILAKDRSKISKRKHPVSVEHYRAEGFLPEAIINYLALLGWNPGTEQEIFSLDELVQAFDIAQVQKSGAIFDEVKMRWFNREYMLRMDPAAFWEHAEEFLSVETVTMLDAESKWKDVIPVMRDRASTFGDVKLADEAGEFALFYKAPTVDPTHLPWKDESRGATKCRLERVLELLEAIPDPWTTESVKAAVWPLAEAEGKGQVLWPFRVALSGRDKSPDPFTISAIIGRDETSSRLRSALSALS